jgi:hypothetical protein
MPESQKPTAVVEPEDRPTDGTPAPAAGSLAERAKLARARAEAEKTIDLEVTPNYAGVLSMRYRALGWGAIAKIRDRHAKIKDDALRELYISCDQLITACEGAFEVQPDGSLKDLNVRWGPRLADLLGVDTPDEATGRQALLAIFGLDTYAVVHFQQYIAWVGSVAPEVDDEVEEGFVMTR